MTARQVLHSISVRRFFLSLILLSGVLPLAAQQFAPELYAGLRWRMIGPFRGGRTVAADGIASQPNVFYVAANNGGVRDTRNGKES